MTSTSRGVPARALLVGSVPLAGPEEAFRTTVAVLGDHIKRLPNTSSRLWLSQPTNNSSEIEKVRLGRDCSMLIPPTQDPGGNVEHVRR